MNQKIFIWEPVLDAPLIAKRQVEIAEKEGATMVAHGATGKGNDQVRFELTFMALNPNLKIVAPWKDPKWDLHSREDCLAYADQHNIPVVQSKSEFIRKIEIFGIFRMRVGCLKILLLKRRMMCLHYLKPLNKHRIHRNM